MLGYMTCIKTRKQSLIKNFVVDPSFVYYLDYKFNWDTKYRLYYPAFSYNFIIVYPS